MSGGKRSSDDPAAAKVSRAIWSPEGISEEKPSARRLSDREALATESFLYVR
jgi:hypothetical protein